VDERSKVRVMEFEHKAGTNLDRHTIDARTRSFRLRSCGEQHSRDNNTSKHPVRRTQVSQEGGMVE
jgi:hypothetical protein